MTTRNWRTKNLRGGCNHSPSICSSYPEPYVDPYIPTTLTTLSFTNIGNTDWTVPAYVTSVEYLVVGGGGGGGGAYDTGSAGGGGAGLVLTGTLSVIPGILYTITVGGGGSGGIGTKASTPYETAGTNGSASIFATITANGGGGGWNSRNAYAGTGQGGLQADGLTSPTGGSGAGNAVGNDNGGGGGGNASDGMGPTYSPAISYGGNGIDSNLSSSVVTYGTGGNGGRVNTSIAGTNGTANTGNGGGGASAVSSDGKSGGSGGSGIVILKYYV